MTAWKILGTALLIIFNLYCLGGIIADVFMARTIRRDPESLRVANEIIDDILGAYPRTVAVFVLYVLSAFLWPFWVRRLCVSARGGDAS